MWDLMHVRSFQCSFTPVGSLVYKSTVLYLERVLSREQTPPGFILKQFRSNCNVRDQT